ncbi:MAG: hypothetical protein QM765_05265 [Myxococcales bacterium]
MSSSPSSRKRFVHALLMCVLALGLGFTLWSGFHLEHGTSPSSTQFHELLGWTAGVVVALHVALRWRWLSSVVRQLPRLKGEARTNLILGTALTLALGLEVASGALLEPGNAWRGLHHLSSKLVIPLGVWHVVRHWGWLKLRLVPWAARRGGENPVLRVGPAR